MEPGGGASTRPWLHRYRCLCRIQGNTSADRSSLHRFRIPTQPDSRQLRLSGSSAANPGFESFLRRSSSIQLSRQTHNCRRVPASAPPAISARGAATGAALWQFHVPRTSSWLYPPFWSCRNSAGCLHVGKTAERHRQFERVSRRAGRHRRETGPV